MRLGAGVSLGIARMPSLSMAWSLIVDDLKDAVVSIQLSSARAGTAMNSARKMDEKNRISDP
jgi:hypothetical protein